MDVLLIVMKIAMKALRLCKENNLKKLLNLCNLDSLQAKEISLNKSLLLLPKLEYVTVDYVPPSAMSGHGQREKQTKGKTDKEKNGQRGKLTKG